MEEEHAILVRSRGGPRPGVAVVTVEWLPVKERHEEAGYSKQQLILGTHTSEGEQNYLMRAEVALPLEDSETDNRYVACSRA